MTKNNAFLYPLLLLFLFLLTLNLLSPLCVDDFTYLFDFSDGTPVESPLDIIPSMRAHGEKMNGRLMAHGLVQLFLLLPAAFFEVLNPLMLILLLALILSLAKNTPAPSRLDPLAVIVLFFGFWLICPAFGEVALWLTGSVNYLWANVFALLFLLPYHGLFLGKSTSAPAAVTWLFPFFGFFAGAYSENTSAAMIGMAALFLIASALFHRRRPPLYLLMAWLFSVLGYAFMLTRPAERLNKTEELTLSRFFEHLGTAGEMYLRFLIPALLFLALLAFSLIKKKDRCRIVSAGIFFAGSLASNFIMAFASYYPARCALAPAVFLLAALAILARECFSPLLFAPRGKKLAKAALALFFLICLFPLIIGTADIAKTGLAMHEAKKTLVEAAEKGEASVTLPLLKSKTEWGVLYELKYLDPEDPASWPNHDMAKHHGLDAVFAEQ